MIALSLKLVCLAYMKHQRMHQAVGHLEMRAGRGCEGSRNLRQARAARLGMLLAAVCSLCVGLSSPPLRAQIDESILPAMYRTTWNPGIPGGIPADNDRTRPATVWLPSGNPYGGYSVDPSLIGAPKAAAFTSVFQAAINSAGAAATPTHRQIVLLAPGKYFVNAQTYPHPGSQVGIYVNVDNVTIRGAGATATSIIANTNVATKPFAGFGTLILFGHRYGSSDADFAVQNVTADARLGSTTIQIANASAYVVGDVIQIDHQDGPAALDPGGAAEFNEEYLWFFDDQYFQRQSTYGWDGPGTGAAAFSNVTDLPSANANARNSVHQWRTTVQEDEISAIHGNTLTLKDPLNIDFAAFSETADLARDSPEYCIDPRRKPVGRAGRHPRCRRQ